MSVSSVRSSFPARGVVGSVCAGYRLAWTKRQELLAVVAPVVAVAALVRLGLGRFGGDPAGLIVNGVPRPAAAPVWADWVALAVTVLCWSVAIAAGTAVVSRTVLGSPVGAAAAWRLGLRACVPVTVAMVLSAVLAGLVLVLLAASAGRSGVVGLLVCAAVLLVPAGAVLSRVALVVPAAVLGGRAAQRPLKAAFTLTRGRVLRTARPVLLGAVFVPLFVAWVGDGLLARWLAGTAPHDRLGWLLAAAGQQLLSTLVIVVVTTAQAATLATVYLQRLAELGNPAITDPAVGAAADADQRSGLPVTSTGRRRAFPRAARATVGAVLLPAIGAAAVSAVNPYHVPSVSEHDLRLAGLVLAVAWPAGRHPVIVTEFDAYDCPDDECRDPVPRGMRADFAMRSGAVTIGGDGSVLAGIIVRPAGHDLVKLERCSAAGGCRAIEPVPLPSGGGQPQPHLALSVAPDGTPVLATVGDLSRAAGAAPSAQLALIRCLDTSCARSQRTVLGTVPASTAASVAGTDALSAVLGGAGLPTASPALRLDTGPAGQPIVTFRAAAQVWRATCQPGTCDQPRLVDDQAMPGDRFTPVGGVDDGELTLTDIGLVRCQLAACSPPMLHSPGLPGENDLVATAGGVFVVLGAPGPPPPGLHITIGPKPEPRRYILWHCPDLTCLHPRSIALRVTQSPARQTWLAAQPNGHVLLLQSNRTTLSAVTVNTAED